MKITKAKTGMLIVLTSVLYLTGPCGLRAQPGPPAAASARWNVLVDRINPGDTNIDPAFQAAIYENLIEELAKTKSFKQVFRQGDRTANGVSDLLILKTTVEKYKPGSETRRAVTTVSGATKLRVNSQLCTNDGEVLFQSVADGNVRFFGGNLRATHNLAKHVAAKLKQAKLPSAGPKQGSTDNLSARDSRSFFGSQNEWR